MTEAAVIGKGKYTAPFLQVVSASDNGLLVNRNDGDGYSELQRLDAENEQTLSKTKHINSLDVHPQAGVLATRSITYADGRVLSDVFVYQDDRWTQLTEKQRFRMAKWLLDGHQYLASRKVDGLSELWLMDANNPESKTLIWQGEEGDVLGGFSLAPQGDFLVASMKRPQQGWNLERFDLTSATWHKLTDSRAVENARR